MKNRITKAMIIDTMKADYTLFYNPMPEEWKTIIPVVTIDFLSECGLHFTEKHTGKMAGMQSLSTTCKCNDLCIGRIENALKKADPNFNPNSKDAKKKAKKAIRKALKEDPYRQDISICGFCFSDSQQDYQTSMINPLARNFEILNNGIIDSDWLPIVNALYFRFESFGDFASVNSVINCFNFCRKNSHTNCAAWTKNPYFFKKAILKGYQKPENLNCILSSQYINRIADIDYDLIGIFDKTFSVFTYEMSEENAIKINCGARSCLSCLRCYRKNSETEIFELLK